MSLLKFELKKIWQRPIVLIVLIGVVLLDLFSMLIGGYQDEYSANAPAFRTNIQELQTIRGYFAGAITDEWTEKYLAEDEAILADPKYRVSEEEVDAIVKIYVEQYGMQEETVRQRSFLFLTDEGKKKHDNYEDVNFSSRFYERAAEMGALLAENYRMAYPGEKGETLAAAAEAYYNKLADEYTAYYNYNYGYQKFRNMMTMYPYTIGILVLVGLSGIFASEYSGKTDALVLTAKYGKTKVIGAKIKAGLLFAFAAWLIITVLNILVIFSLYGTTGWEAYWQNWIMDTAPYLWNQGQISIISMFTSLLGTLFYAMAVMLISVWAKSPLTSIVFGAVLLLFPTLDLAFTSSGVFYLIYWFLPTRMLCGISFWQQFELFYIFGRTVPIHFVILVTTAVVCSVMVPLIKRTFSRRQAE